jgi:(2S)-methylsuccinyl-CoA dehydrogenase
MNAHIEERPHISEQAEALDVLTAAKLLFHEITDSLAVACSSGGCLDSPAFDALQVACFELAWAAADLAGAEAALGSRIRIGQQLDDELALLFCADAIPRILGRLETIAIEIGAQTDAIHELATDKRLAQLRKRAGGRDAVQRVADAVIQSDGDVGRFVLPEDCEIAQAAFRRFAREVVQPQAEAIHRYDLTVPDTLLDALRDMGVFGLSVPDFYGGSATGAADALLMVLVTEALSEGSLAAAGSLITRPEILTRALLAGGTDQQKAYWLPRIAVGDPLCAIAITEPDYGSDVAGLSLKATRVPGGWCLTGAKTWCTFAGKAGLLMVVARTNPDRSLGHKGLSIFLLEKPSFDSHEFSVTSEGEGTLSGRAISTIGYRGMHSFDLSFDRFFVPEANLIGGESGLGQGFYYTMAGMMGGRLQTAARACGVMRAALRASIRYTSDRSVFGRKLQAYPLTQSKLARMAAQLAGCRSLAFSVAQRSGGESQRAEASLVKLLACRSAENVTREALQLHGGMGYAEETSVSRFFVDARVLSIFEGAEETLALKVIARSLLETSLQA